MTEQIRLLNAFLWPFSSSTAIHGIILSNRLRQSRIAPQPGGPQITPELEMRTIPSPPDGMFIWGDTESVFIRGQALVSVISRPCCGGNAYYVVVRGPCLLWPWGLFPWRNGAPRNERSDHRKPPWEWKKEWPKHCQICKKVFSFSHLHPLFTNTFPVSHITLCLHLSGYVLIVFFFFIPSPVNFLPPNHTISFCFLCMWPQNFTKPRALTQALPSTVCVHVRACMCTWSAPLKSIHNSTQEPTHFLLLRANRHSWFGIEQTL